jgi:hypothetical protein
MEKEIVFINVHGYILAIELKTNGDNVSIRAVGGDDDGKITCSCNVSGSCPKKTHFSGVVWCESDNCTKCTMNLSIINSEGEVKALSSREGKITIE